MKRLILGWQGVESCFGGNSFVKLVGKRSLVDDLAKVVSFLKDALAWWIGLDV